MTTDIAKITITPEDRQLIKETICKDATESEMKLFFYDCQRRGTHPLDRKIHFTKRQGRYTPIVGIDFMRERADSTGQLAGIGEPEFTGTPKKDDFCAKVTVKKIVSGLTSEFVGVARWPEFYPGDAVGFMWKKMPHNQLAKCAEAAALRKGFSAAMAGIYLHEEMDMDREPEAEISPVPDELKPDTWIEGSFKEIITGYGAHPNQVAFRVDLLGDSEWRFHLLGNVEGLEHIEPNQRVRFQYGKAGKFRALTAIEPLPLVLEGQAEEISQDPPAVNYDDDAEWLRWLAGMESNPETSAILKRVKKEMGIKMLLKDVAAPGRQIIVDSCTQIEADQMAAGGLFT